MIGFVRAYEGDEPYIFISYAHKDSEMVLPVICELHSLKYRIWYDEGITPGSEWPQNISRHLQEAAAVMVFVSENSLASPNCENEVIAAINNKKKIIPICLDGASIHKLLSGNEALNFDEKLIDKLINGGHIGNEFIGDGVTGYQYEIGKKRSYNIWNLLLGLAAALVVVISAALYGLFNGLFDRFLPSKQPVFAATPTPEQTPQAIPDQLKSVLPVEFTSEDEKNAVYQLLGWPSDSVMTHANLSEMNGITSLMISDGSIKDISFAAYLPNLDTIRFENSKVTDLSQLVYCKNLKTIQVTADMLPLTLPENRSFKVEVIF